MPELVRFFKWPALSFKTNKICQQYSVLAFRTTHTIFFFFFFFFFAKRIARLPEKNRFSHTLLVTITLVCFFVCGLIHYEADITVGKGSIAGVNA